LTSQEIANALETKWAELESLGSRKRILPSHPLKLYVSKTHTRNRVLQIEGEVGFDGLDLKKLKSLDFHTSDDSTTLSIELTDEGFTSQFLAFLHDLILNTSRMDKHAAGLHLISRLEDWAKLFARARSSGLSDSQALGLRGELEVLRSLLERVSSKLELVEGWRGPNGDRTDIGWGKFRVEVKSKRATSSSGIQISSADQLAVNPGRLFLYVQYLNSGDEDGASINEVVNGVQEMLRSDQAATQLFNAKLLTAGFDADDPTCSVAYSAVSADIFDVAEGFPKLTPNDMPTGVVKLSYELESSSISMFRVEPNVFFSTVVGDA